MATTITAGAAVVALAAVGVPDARAAEPALTVRGQSQVVYPNSPGSSAGVQYCNDEPLTVAADIVDADQQVVRPLLARARIAPYSCFSENVPQVNWDGTLETGVPAPDGPYAFRFEATEDDGTVTTSTVDVEVDGRPPAPADAFSLYSRPDGLTDWTFKTTPGFTFDEIIVSCGSDQLALTTQPTEQDVWSGTFDLSVCARGWTPELTAFWHDEFGSRHVFVIRPPVVPPPPVSPVVVTLPPVEGMSFSPDGDGRDDVAELPYCLRGTGRLRITVQQAESEHILRTLDRSTISSPDRDDCRTAVFDGRDDDGQLLPDGRYWFVVRLDDDANSSSEAFSWLDVDTSPPARVTEPSAGSRVDARLDVGVVAAAEVSVGGVTASTAGLDPTSAYAPGSDGVWRTELDTASLAEGPREIKVEVVWFDRYGRYRIWNAPPVNVIVDHGHLVTILTSSLPDAVRGRHYTASLEAEGGDGTYTWKVVRGRLPRGLRLDRMSGAITGSPRVAGSTQLTVRATDGAGTSATQDLVLDVRRR